jgi:flagella basal body P-ring formation protein FlgA
MPRAVSIIGILLALGLGTSLPAAAQQVVMVPTRVIYPGETVSADALRPVTLSDGRVPPAGMAVLPEELDGKVAKKTLVPDRYIPQAALREAYLVETGKPVHVVFAVGSLVITATAVSLQSGSAGDFVKLRNLDSGKIIAGTVMADGTVRVSAS